jgi:hypothetical protein
MNDKNKQPIIFADGLNIYPPTEKTQSFLFAKAGINVNKFKEFLDKHVNEKGYVNINFPLSKTSGQPYAVLDTYKSQSTRETKATYEEFNADEIGF